MPLLKTAAFYQIMDGNSSIWSTPWFPGWDNIHDSLIIQSPPFVYPSVVKDLWLPNQKKWNVALVNTLFQPQTAQSILATSILSITDQDNFAGS
jgi:hypothetical protein